MVNAIASRSRSVQADLPQGKTVLRIFPILGSSNEEPPYRLLEGDALSAVQVTETSPSGSVPELKVENTLDVRVFLMDGQELIGAKQNRILNTDVLVPAKSSLTIPVSCVEAGRWRHTSQIFSPGKSASHSIRSRKSERVKSSLRETGKHDANQGAVWNEVQMSMDSSCTSSPTSSLHDAYDQKQKDLDTFRSSLKMPENTVGIAVFHGSGFLGLDLFDRHSTLVYFWQSLIESYAIDWLMAESGPSGATSATPEAKAVADILERAAVASWESFPAPGEGSDHRLEDEQLTGSALVWEDKAVLHMQLFPKQPTESQSPTPTHRPRIRRPYGRQDIIY